MPRPRRFISGCASAPTRSAHLESLRAAGVNHVALNLRFNRADIGATMRRLTDHVLPEFHH